MLFRSEEHERTRKPIVTSHYAGTVGVPVSCTITPPVSGNTTSSAPIQNVTISWGDNTGEQPLGTVTGATVVAHTYAAAGVYQLQAAATDANSQRGTAIVTINVTRVLPTITFSTCPSTATVGVPVAFGVTPAATPTIPLQGVTISFGDGTSRDLGQITGVTGFTKAFTSEGGYTVTATVTDTFGQRGTSSCSVVVSKSATPTITFSQTSSKTHRRRRRSHPPTADTTGDPAHCQRRSRRRGPTSPRRRRRRRRRRQIGRAHV